MLNKITPLVLTYNEAPNIRRTLEGLSWARDVVVVDSFSDDATVEIIAGFPQARVYQRVFDTHEKQWNFGLKETGISSEWVLALDADYLLSPEFILELSHLSDNDGVTGYRAKFTYCINGRPLRSGVYPEVAVLYRRAAASYVQDGHTQRVAIDGKVVNLQSPLLHDDRKPLSHWFPAQQRYTKLEANKLLATPVSELSFNDRIRRWRVVAPAAVLFYCLVIRGGVLDGWPGIFYSLQRMFAELMLSLYLLEHDLGRATSKPEPAKENKHLPPVLGQIKSQGTSE